MHIREILTQGLRRTEILYASPVATMPIYFSAFISW